MRSIRSLILTAAMPFVAVAVAACGANTPPPANGTSPTPSTPFVCPVGMSRDKCEVLMQHHTGGEIDTGDVPKN